jgi:amino acid transporter
LAKEPTAFLREATGLVRGIGPIDALVFAIGAVIGPTWIPILVAEWSFYPGVSIPASFILTAALGGVWGLYYVVITGIFPRSGGGSYVPLSRTISPALGMMMSFGYIVALSLTLGYVASTILPVAIASPLQTYAELTNNSTLQNLATSATSQFWTILSGTIFLAIGAAIAIFGRRVTLTINKIAFVLGTLGFLTIIYVFATTSQANFEAAFNTFVGSPNAYQSISTAAHANGFAPSASWVGPTLLSLPFSLFAILGFQSPSFFSGEIRKPSKSMLFAVIGAVIYGGFMYALVATLMEKSLGSDFVTSASYLFNVSPGNYNLSFPPYANAFITIIDPSPIINILVLVSIISFGYLIMMFIYYVGSRLFLAWSFDRIFPSALGRVSDRFNSPVLAIVVTAIVAWGAFLVYSLFPATVGFINLAFVIIAAESLDGFAGIALPFFRKRMFESAPPFVRRKVGGVPLVALLGGYSVALMFAMFAIAFHNPIVVGPFNVITSGTIIVSLLLGLGIYLGMRAYNARRGIDTSLAFKEIPPE